MASPKALPLLCLLSFLVLFSSPHAEAAKADFFYLTLLWPGIICSGGRCCMPTTGEPAADFSVQALESYDSATGQPVTNCFNSSCRFFVNSLSLSLSFYVINFRIEKLCQKLSTKHKLRPFIDDMYAHWADVSCPSNNGVDLWRLTWCTYGTCSNLTQVQYFQGALNLSAKLDLLNVLAIYDIVPSNTKFYKLEDIQSSLEVKYGFSTVVECRRFRSYSQLSMVRFCVSADVQRLIPCPISRISTCGPMVKFAPFTVDMLEPYLGSKPVMLPAQKDLVM